ncbi:hypothetical protein [Cylindrospermopsis raciborskii]|uniref:hypothetical protein n=1 Tax=Cylindrospermopsis raciborskii TaxID=77022 RepID=UPI001114ECD4|nr:hypothetical protein [Cylindrospermopsis raciborskii]NLQ03568.1 hypothetical protein [Cylindrospermopsis raciborskii MVCC19]
MIDKKSISAGVFTIPIIDRIFISVRSQFPPIPPYIDYKLLNAIAQFWLATCNNVQFPAVH